MLRSLFYETQNNRQELQAPIQDDAGPRPVFTLKTRDYEINETSPMYRHQGPNLLKSLHILFLEYSDPTEYSFAQGVFGEQGGWEHWLKLREAAFFKRYYVRMREALVIKMESDLVAQAKRIAKAPLGPQSLQAIKWLHGVLRQTEKSKRGRPSNDEIEGELKRKAEEAEDLSDDIERLGL
jgi:hypothetical protein